MTLYWRIFKLEIAFVMIINLDMLRGFSLSSILAISFRKMAITCKSLADGDGKYIKSRLI